MNDPAARSAVSTKYTISLIVASKGEFYPSLRINVQNKIINVRTYAAQEAITLIGIYCHRGPWS
jgi:hypothetical protein